MSFRSLGLAVLLASEHTAAARAQGYPVPGPLCDADNLTSGVPYTPLSQRIACVEDLISALSKSKAQGWSLRHTDQYAEAAEFNLFNVNSGTHLFFSWTYPPAAAELAAKYGDDLPGWVAALQTGERLAQVLAHRTLEYSSVAHILQAAVNALARWEADEGTPGVPPVPRSVRLRRLHLDELRNRYLACQSGLRIDQGACDGGGNGGGNPNPNGVPSG